MASSRRASGPDGLGRSASSVASVNDAASANAGSIGASTAGLIGSGLLLQFHRLGALGGAVGTKHDLLQAHLGALELLLAVRLQGHPALVKRDRILKVHFTLLEPGDNGLQLLQSRLEAQIFDDRQRLWTCFLHRAVP